MNRFLCLSGSLRAESFNTRLLGVARGLLDGAGGQSEAVSADTLRALPLMDQDLEAREGLPEPARELKRRFAQADGLLIASPEYNGSVTPLLKNVIDWVSRPDEDLPAPRCFGGKPVALIAASPSALGGMRGLRHVREILGNLGALVVPAQFTLPAAGNAFDDNGLLSDPKRRQALSAVIDDLLFWARASKGAH